MDGRSSSFPEHGDGQLHQGIDEAFALYPLLAQDDGDGDHGQVHGGDEGQPVDERRQPPAPRYALSHGCAFVEILDLGEFPERHDPLRNVRQQQVAPVVFSGGVVGGDRGTVEDHVAIRHSTADGRRSKGTDDQSANSWLEGGGRLTHLVSLITASVAPSRST